jgi:hypothetical protein
MDRLRDSPLTSIRRSVLKRVAGRRAHLEAGMVGFKAVAAGLIPARGVLALLDPVLDISPAVLDLHHLRLI